MLSRSASRFFPINFATAPESPMWTSTILVPVRSIAGRAIAMSLSASRQNEHPAWRRNTSSKGETSERLTRLAPDCVTAPSKVCMRSCNCFPPIGPRKRNAGRTFRSTPWYFYGKNRGRLFRQQYHVDDVNHAVAAHEIRLHDLGVIDHHRAHRGSDHQLFAVYRL